MKQIVKVLVAAGLIISLFTLACNKNTHPAEAPDDISNAVILTWNEVAFDGLGAGINTVYWLDGSML